uniref:Uncharacterized protein n=1 Tax=Romanomermis culicivorax TaxID=13658 RepID=A0A915I881_ROMCU
MIANHTAEMGSHTNPIFSAKKLKHDNFWSIIVLFENNRVITCCVASSTAFRKVAVASLTLILAKRTSSNAKSFIFISVAISPPIH